jgi:hypothetical protein
MSSDPSAIDPRWKNDRQMLRSTGASGSPFSKNQIAAVELTQKVESPEKKLIILNLRIFYHNSPNK